MADARTDLLATMWLVASLLHGVLQAALWLRPSAYAGRRSAGTWLAFTLAGALLLALLLTHTGGR